MESREKTLRAYIDKSGRIPFALWLRSLRDDRAKQKVQVRLARVRLGNFGAIKSVGEGVSELIIDYGPGHRVYLGQDGDEIVILWVGGDKTTQVMDIKKAKDYWHDYKEQNESGDY